MSVGKKINPFLTNRSEIVSRTIDILTLGRVSPSFHLILARLVFVAAWKVVKIHVLLQANPTTHYEELYNFLNLYSRSRNNVLPTILLYKKSLLLCSLPTVSRRKFRKSWFVGLIDSWKEQNLLRVSLDRLESRL